MFTVYNYRSFSQAFLISFIFRTNDNLEYISAANMNLKRSFQTPPSSTSTKIEHRRTANYLDSPKQFLHWGAFSTGWRRRIQWPLHWVARAYALESVLLKVESEGRSILPAQKHRSCRRLAFSRLVCARCIQQIPRERVTHVFSRIDEKMAWKDGAASWPDAEPRTDKRNTAA